MEKILYDMYLAEVEINNNYAAFSSDSVRKQELLNSVLKKHKITEAVLDTSLAWYSGHLEKYFKINDNVSKRYTAAAEKIRRKEGISLKPQTTASAGELILPIGKENFFLQSIDLRNNAFSYKVDTVLNRYGGEYELRFTVLGLDSMRPIVTLCVQCLDTAFVKRDTLSRNGLFTTTLNVRQGKQAKKLYGSIYFPEVNPGMTVFIRDFTLSHSFRSRNLPITQPSK